MKSIKDLRLHLESSTFRQSAITLSGTVLNGLLGILFYIVLARNLSPSDFGIVAICIALLTLISDVADFGTNSGLVRFISSNISDHKNVYRFLKLSLLVKLGVGILVIILGFVIGPFLAVNVFNKPELISPLSLVLVGVLGSLLFSYATSYLQAYQKFLHWSVLNVGSNLFRLVLVFLLIIMGTLNSMNSLFVYVVLPFVGFLLVLFVMPFRKIVTSYDVTELKSHLISFNLWVGITTIIYAISLRLDTFLNTSLLDTTQVGIYSVANQISLIVPQIISAIGIVSAPKFASFDTKFKMMEYFKKLMFFVGILALLGLMALPLGGYLLPVVYGDKYLEAVPIFMILAVAMIIYLVSTPINVAIYYFFGKPKVFVLVSFVHLLTIGLLGYYQIKNFGLMGAAITVFWGMVVNFVIPLIFFIRLVKQKNG